MVISVVCSIVVFLSSVKYLIICTVSFVAASPWRRFCIGFVTSRRMKIFCLRCPSSVPLPWLMHYRSARELHFDYFMPSALPSSSVACGRKTERLSGRGLEWKSAITFAVLCFWQMKLFALLSEGGKFVSPWSQKSQTESLLRWHHYGIYIWFAVAHLHVWKLAKGISLAWNIANAKVCLLHMLCWCCKDMDLCLCLSRTLLRRNFSLRAFWLANSLDMPFLPTCIASGPFERTVWLRVLRETLRTRLPRTTMFFPLDFTGRFRLILGWHFVYRVKTGGTPTFQKLISSKCLYVRFRFL